MSSLNNCNEYGHFTSKNLAIKKKKFFTYNLLYSFIDVHRYYKSIPWRALHSATSLYHTIVLATVVDLSQFVFLIWPSDPKCHSSNFHSLSRQTDHKNMSHIYKRWLFIVVCMSSFVFYNFISFHSSLALVLCHYLFGGLVFLRYKETMNQG